ncbi:MAG: preprotein translocase subunit SecY [Phycisphaerales bacterium]|nr:preprotein translocase subunit SecY [Phycisphaerales bacterium]
MLAALMNVFRIPDLRNKVLFTLGMLIVYRIGFWIPVPGISQQALHDFMQQQTQSGGAVGRMAVFISTFSGGSLGQSTIFGLGIMPYISAAIIFQLLGSAYPPLKKMQQEGPSGRQKITEWTRYATIGLCIIQSFAWLSYITQMGLVYPGWGSNPVWWVMAIVAMTAGTTFLMWLGEQIDKYGIGNGVSLLITAGILANMPGAFLWVVQNSPISQLGFVKVLLGEPPSGDTSLSWMQVILLMGAFVGVVAGAVLITVAQRRIPVQQARHTRGRRVVGGQRSYLPLRVNHGGVMPIIFASSLMIFPAVIFQYLAEHAQAAHLPMWWVNTTRFLGDAFQTGAYPYILLYIVMVYFFSYFWTTVQFNPEDMSKQLRDSGAFIPGLRPGPRTAEYLETVMERITYVGAGFLAIIAVIPMVVNSALNINFLVASFLGGTGLLIVVSVGLDFIQRIEANLLMRNYAGFLGGADGGKGPKIRGARY